jgi:hypothetical protein
MSAEIDDDSAGDPRRTCDFCDLCDTLDDGWCVVMKRVSVCHGYRTRFLGVVGANCDEYYGIPTSRFDWIRFHGHQGYPRSKRARVGCYFGSKREGSSAIKEKKKATPGE